MDQQEQTQTQAQEPDYSPQVPWLKQYREMEQSQEQPAYTPPAQSGTQSSPEPGSQPKKGDYDIYDINNNPMQGAPDNPKSAQDVIDRGVVNVAGNSVAKSDDDPVGDFEGDDLDELIRWLKDRKAAIKIPTKEELEKERRRKKTEGIISSIADASRAVANLAFTTQYAPNMYKSDSTMTGRWKDRWDKLKKERQEDEDNYFNYALMIHKLREGKEQKKYQRGRDALQDQIRLSQEQRAQLNADRNAAMADLKMKLLGGKISEQEAATRAAEIEAEYADDFWTARVDELQSRRRKNDRWQPSSGRGGSGGKGGSTGDYLAYNPDNPAETIHISARNAKEAWTRVPNGWTMRQESTERETTKPNKWGDKQTTTSKTNPNPGNSGPGKKPKGKIGW